jgi:transcription initiation factor TFIIIB Brf1 subunit/transcription initiation factor TFIIB
MKTECKKCHAKQDQDSSKAEQYCFSCGAILSTNKYVQEVDFMNSKVVGKFVHQGMLRGKPYYLACDLVVGRTLWSWLETDPVAEGTRQSVRDWSQNGPATVFDWGWGQELSVG